MIFSRKGADIAHWEAAADDWVRWARAPGHDPYWAYEGALRAFIGPGAGAAIDIGCGEGRVSALLRALGYHVTALDPVERMIAAARDKGSADAYAIAPAARAPFATASFDLVLMCDVITRLDKPAPALTEARRLMREGARLVLTLPHPFTAGAEIEGEGGAARLIREESYFARERRVTRLEGGDLALDEAGWTQPLTFVTEALRHAGFAITRVIEPQPVATSPWRERETWAKFPAQLWVEARA
ncbi:class I SAM-dependent DNA methyltransferase [Pseudoroseicyclus sp. H15]